MFFLDLHEGTSEMMSGTQRDSVRVAKAAVMTWVAALVMD